MVTWRYWLAIVILIAAAPALTQTEPKPETYYRIKVGDNDPATRIKRMQRFHKLLLKGFNVTDLDLKNIGCKPEPKTGTSIPDGVGCEAVDDATHAPNVVALDFVLERRNGGENLGIFATSYHKVQVSPESHDSFYIRIDGQAPPAGACPVPTPSYCGTRRTCPHTDNCDKPKPVGGNCDVCT
jgi:hypothetical protein